MHVTIGPSRAALACASAASCITPIASASVISFKSSRQISNDSHIESAGLPFISIFAGIEKTVQARHYFGCVAIKKLAKPKMHRNIN
ncbi:hypothetical protein [Oryzicola mucosus]|uniref:Secreted protein n=1 Tax=Oryzicola mucosus TaxID=2767425 RepID=A0A8J6U0H8_9HYPH|nr:hypothetical protein [Oryzicola mucosus]MBD0415676.1 hypothetical protein [Oryzicola mucosus]